MPNGGAGLCLRHLDLNCWKPIDCEYGSTAELDLSIRSEAPRSHVRGRTKRSAIDSAPMPASIYSQESTEQRPRKSTSKSFDAKTKNTAPPSSFMTISARSTALQFLKRIHRLTSTETIVSLTRSHCHSPDIYSLSRILSNQRKCSNFATWAQAHLQYEVQVTPEQSKKRIDLRRWPAPRKTTGDSY